MLKSTDFTRGPIHIFGGNASVRALLVARYFRLEANRPLVVICANDEVAVEFAADLEVLSQAVEGVEVAVCHFPTWEQSPYSPIRPSIRTRLARVACLSELSGVSDGKVPVIVTTIAALCQATIPKEYFDKNFIKIKAGGNVESREALASRLVEAGYLRIDPVEDPGTFAVRGEIIDVFPPDQSKPIRIELFDTEIEKIRFFDPATQRTLSDDAGTAAYGSGGGVSSGASSADGRASGSSVSAGGVSSLREIKIPPAREVLVNSETADYLREQVKARADHLEIHRSARDPILSAIRDRISPERSDTWAPFCYPNPSTLWEYLQPGPGVDGGVEWRVVWIDELSCRQEWDQFIEKQKQLSEEATQSELITPPVEELFRWDSRLESLVQSQSSLFLDRITLAPTSEVGVDGPDGADGLAGAGRESYAAPTSLRIEIEKNSDLIRSSRHPILDLEPQLRSWTKEGFRIIVLAATPSQLDRIRFLLDERNLRAELKLGSLSEGFRWTSEGLIVLTEGEILGTKHLRKARKSSASGNSSASKSWSGLQALSDLSVGDAVVHVDHGIGRYQGIVRLDLLGAPSDFLLLEYANKDRLYLPVYRLNVIQKYVGAGEGVALDRLGTQLFQKTKDKVRESVKKLAIDLVQLYALRKIQAGFQFGPKDSAYQEFEAQFAFDETPDQLKAINDVLADLESGKVMDRLVCGDVGYGKTEVAIRAAFKAVSEGKQVVVLVPTTILAQQHELSFKTRLNNYPLLIESVSRFKTSKEQQAILKAASEGKIDILIGTHRLLSKDVQFQDLGLVIVDEEHRFGVEHKERLKTLKVNTHVLTLTATPIPRTLHMALSGLRDISLINTPPIDRLPIRTYVSKYEDSLIQKVIEFELSRGGQVFYLHNRVQTIHKVAGRIKELVPAAQVLVAHGQMPETELENTMTEFAQKKGNVLVCTTIIESGLDIPSANTIIVDRADTLGLAQLYQIRGRVGRGQQRAYAYLLIPGEGILTEDAKRRLEVIQRFVELGSGFSIASHDLEIRGGGDILGPQQSGSIAAVGFDLYTELLEEAIREIQGKPVSQETDFREPEIKTPFPAFLSEEYIPDVHQRLSLYRRFSAALNDADVDRLEEEMRDRFGDLPMEAQNLLWLIRIKIILKNIGIESLTVGPEKISLVSGAKNRIDSVRIIALVSGRPNEYSLAPDSKLVIRTQTASLKDLFFKVETVSKELT